eukprot:TRINITY_DN2613_c0_g3_i2.p2 TRINITY_DN2613_c0_g3~~TRINITY_DN2613_c0_g3_i2.p2  ORF type:complete len:130 (-),score=37.85 TRINITY_DN2613_c0_g3_i2:18-407(-)
MSRMARLEDEVKYLEIMRGELDHTMKLMSQVSSDNLAEATGIIEENSDLKKRLVMEMKQRRNVSDKLEALEEDMKRIRGKTWLNYNRTTFFVQLFFWLALLFFLWQTKGTSFPTTISSSKYASGSFRRQ